MAKKRRHRIWWFAVFAPEYADLVKKRVLPVPTILFDKQEMAYSVGYAERFEPIRDEHGNHVTVSDYAQLKDRGRITIVGIHGDAIDWSKKTVVVERAPEGNIEMAHVEQPVAMTDKVVYKIMEESDEMYARHLQSPLARAGGLTVPQDVKDRIEARRVAEEAKREIAEQAERLKGENPDGEDARDEAHAVTAEAGDSQA